MKKYLLKDKHYVHFDAKTQYKDYKNKITNFKWVESHDFYPFVHVVLDRSKFTDAKIIKHRYRDIYYSSHVDSYIYQYYGQELNDMYNKYAKQTGINNVAIAYRNCWRGKCNIHFAKEVFEFVSKTTSSYIFIADLSNFFDTLDFAYLKKQIKKVMGVTELDKAHYSIFKSLTHYSYVDYDDIEKVTNLSRTELVKLYRFFDAKTFREHRKELVKRNNNGKGIPQGSSISAVYANAYMVDFDKAINDYVTTRGGIYRRYCDDIIVVIPFIGEMDMSLCKDISNHLISLQNDIPNLEINLDKTKEYICKDTKIFSLVDKKTSEVSYLGFNYDGVHVRIRDKSVFKYYCRAYRKIDRINQYFYDGDMNSYIAGKKAIYNGYTHLFNPKRTKKKNAQYGNFITYAYRAHEIFSQSPLLESKIRLQLRRHWKKIDSKIVK